MSMTIEDYDFALCDLVEQPPLDHYDMVIALAEGRFIVEGKPSIFSEAEYYAQEHSDEEDVWKALAVLTF
jgi:hypothetical protein